MTKICKIFIHIEPKRWLILSFSNFQYCITGESRDIKISVVHCRNNTACEANYLSRQKFKDRPCIFNFCADHMVTAHLVAIWWEVWHRLYKHCCFNTFWHASFEQGHQQHIYVQCLNVQLQCWWLANNQVALLTTCMTTPDDSDCTINAVSTSLPLLVCSFFVLLLLPLLLACCFCCSFCYKNNFTKNFCPGDKHRQLHDLNRWQQLHGQLRQDGQLRQQQGIQCQPYWMASTTKWVETQLLVCTLNIAHPSIRSSQSSGMPSIVQCTLGTTALTFGNVATEDGKSVGCNKWNLIGQPMGATL